MRYFLAKTDPETYSIDDFEKEKISKWDGVHNYAALLVIKSWKIGDTVLIYHSQKNPGIVGLATVISDPEKDKDDSQGISWLAKLKFVRKFPPENFISLKEIKASGLFNDFALIKQSRLSVMACPEHFISYLKEKGVDISIAFV